MNKNDKIIIGNSKIKDESNNHYCITNDLILKLIDRRNNRAALDAALSLTTNSKKKDINNVLNMPMTSSFKVKLNEIVKKKMIKLHEQYKSSGKEEEFLEIINEYIGNEL